LRTSSDVLDAETVANIKSVLLETGFSLSHAAIMGNAAGGVDLTFATHPPLSGVGPI
jgi:hypothetical protein